MKDYKLKLRNLHVSYTLGWSWNTGLVVELEHLKTKTRLIDKKFESVRGECEI